MPARAAAAQQLGMDEEMVAKIHDYESSDLPKGTRLALAFTERWVNDHGQTIDDSLIARMKEHFTEDQIVELAIAVSLFDSAHRFNSAFAIDPPVSGVYTTGAPAVPEQMRRHLESLGLGAGEKAGMRLAP